MTIVRAPCVHKKNRQIAPFDVLIRKKRGKKDRNLKINEEEHPPQIPSTTKGMP